MHSKSPTRNGNPLPVTMVSKAMQQMYNEMLRAAKSDRYIRLVIAPEDAHELISFVLTAAERNFWAKPIVVRPETTTLFSDGIRFGDTRPVLFLKGDSISDRVCDHFLYGHFQRPRDLVIAAFPTPQSCERAWADGRAVELRPIFERGPTLTWPKLPSREADIPGIAQAICKHFSNDKIRLSTDAAQHIRRSSWKNIADMLAVMRHCHRTAEMTKSDQITADILVDEMRAHRSKRPPARTSSIPPTEIRS